MVAAFVGIKVGSGEIDKAWIKNVRENVKKMAGVKEVYSVMGSFDLMTKVEAKSIEELSNIVIDGIRVTPGVLSTETLLIVAP